MNPFFDVNKRGLQLNRKFPRQSAAEFGIACGLMLLVAIDPAVGQQRVVTTPDGQTIVIEGGQPISAVPTQAATATPADEKAAKAEGTEAAESKVGKEGESKDKKKEDGPPSVIKRPKVKQDDKKPEPIESQVLLKDRKITFDLKGQPWLGVMEWIADVSDLSLDWQELPGDSLNLTTTREYSLEEARDILNRHLLTRGYTMVLDGELLSVLKLSDIKPSLVPRVSPEELDEMLDHTLCKVSFDLDWLLADETIEEITPLLSKAGKISKMSRTNRLEIMDTAGSLRDIHNILKEEQSDTGQEQLVKTFPLKHRRAEEVIVLLRDLLGVDPPPGGGGGGMGFGGGMGQVTSVMQQMTQQLQRMAQSQGGGGGKGGQREPTKTRLVLNPRENMILVQAMPDQMAIIEKAISQIDVEIEASNSLIQNINRVKIYRLETIDPQTLVDLLNELGDMSPGTVLKADKEQKSIIAFGSLSDHLTITSLVERMDQKGRDVEVIYLKRLDAEYVAGTIQALMGPKEEEKNSRSSYYRYGYSEPEKEEKEFKIEPDIENNRLLVYANKTEMSEIMLLLQKLGEIPDPNAVDKGIRLFDLGPGDDPQELMQRLQKMWGGKNKLEFDLPETQHLESEEADQAKETVDETITKSGGGDLTSDEFFAMFDNKQVPSSQSVITERPWPVRTRNTEVMPDVRSQVLTVADEPKPSSSAASDSISESSPIRFGLTADGRLMVTSDDKDALNQMEDLLREVVRPLPNYRIFYMKYATPSWVTLNLKDYFESEEDSGSGMTYDPYWGGFLPSSSKGSSKSSLGSRRQPRFIHDNFTSTILVRNADRRQLKVIEDLIKIYDVPEPADTRAMRVTKIFKLENSKAEIVAQAVKDVFRDLLSSNDKALEKKDGEKTQTQVYSYFGDDQAEGDDEAPIRFKGLLSIGVDGLSNTLVISSTASLMEIISELILSLDEAAEKSSAVRVLKVDSSVDLKMIQERLNKSLGVSSDGNQPRKNNPSNPNAEAAAIQQQQGQSVPNQ